MKEGKGKTEEKAEEAKALSGCPFGCGAQIDLHELALHRDKCPEVTGEKVREKRVQLAYQLMQHSNIQTRLLPHNPPSLPKDPEEFRARLNVLELGEQYEALKEAYLVYLPTTTSEIRPEERSQLVIAYKSIIGSYRSTWMSYKAQVECAKTEDEKASRNTLKELKKAQICRLCLEVRGLVEKHILPKLQTVEGKVFFDKMLGDYYRYQAECLDGKGEAEDCVKKAGVHYEQARVLAEEKLLPTNPIRLGNALNYSVYCFELLHDGRKGRKLCQDAFNEALKRIDEIPEEDYKDATMIMQLLRDSMPSMWADEDEDKQPNS